MNTPAASAGTVSRDSPASTPATPARDSRAMRAQPGRPVKEIPRTPLPGRLSPVRRTRGPTDERHDRNDDEPAAADGDRGRAPARAGEAPAPPAGRAPR